jgi:hypothetical protein
LSMNKTSPIFSFYGCLSILISCQGFLLSLMFCSPSMNLSILGCLI